MLEFKLSLGVALQRFEVDDQGIFDGKYGIVFHILVDAIKDLRCQRFVLGMRNL